MIYKQELWAFTCDNILKLILNLCGSQEGKKRKSAGFPRLTLSFSEI